MVGSSHAERAGDALIRVGGFTVKKVIMHARLESRQGEDPTKANMETAMRDEPEDSLVVLQLLDSSCSPYRGGGSRPS